MKKLLPLLVVAFFLLITIVWFGKYTVTSGERFDEFSKTSYGYKVEKYFFWNSTTLTFWSNKPFSGTSSVYEFSSTPVDKIDEERWLNNNTAIYLNLRIKSVDLVDTFGAGRIIYDFHRGEMHTASRYTLWRIWNEKNKSEDWLNDEEFDAILLRLNR